MGLIKIFECTYIFVCLYLCQMVLLIQQLVVPPFHYPPSSSHATEHMAQPKWAGWAGNPPMVTRAVIYGFDFLQWETKQYYRRWSIWMREAAHSGSYRSALLFFHC